MYKLDLASNNLQWLMCHKTKPNLTGTTTVSQSGPGSNGNEVVLYIPQIFRTSASSSNAVLCHTQNISFLGGVFTSLREIHLKYKPC